MSSSRRVLAVLGAAAVVLALQTVPSYATVTDLYVATDGDNANPCTQDSPCLTVQHAVDAASSTGGTTVHVGAGSFDGAVSSTEDVSIVGTSADATTLTDTTDAALSVFDISAATTTLSDLTIHGAIATPVLVTGTGHVVAQHVVLDGGLCSLGVINGQAEVSDSVLQDGGQGSGAGCGIGVTDTPLSGDVGILTGTVSLVRTQVLSPATDQPGVGMLGGTLSADQTDFGSSASSQLGDTSNGLQVQGGSATMTRSTVHGYSQGVDASGGTTLLTDDTFDGNVVGVNGVGGSTTVVRSTFQDELGSLQTFGVPSTLSVAGSVLGTDSIGNCNNAVTDLGYNLATDDSCGFTGTSHDSVTGLSLDTDLADRGGPPLPGGPLETVAIFDPSTAVDTIPAGATYGEPAVPLCPARGATDLRGVPRPVGGACDAGSMELAGTTTSLTAPRTAKPHQDVDLVATVATTDVGVEGLETPPQGTVTFRAGSKVLCQGGMVHLGEVRCTTSSLRAGRVGVTATYVPVVDVSTLHASTSPAQLVVVGTAPRVSGPRRVVVHVGRRARVTLRGTGTPTPSLKVTRGKAPMGMRVTKRAGRLTITGKPRAGALGRHTLGVKVTNPTGSATRTLTIVVKRG